MVSCDNIIIGRQHYGGLYHENPKGPNVVFEFSK